MCAYCWTTTNLLILYFKLGKLSQGEPLDVESNREWSTIDLVGREIVVERAKDRLEKYIEEVEQQQRRDLLSLAARVAPDASGGNENRTAAGTRDTRDSVTGGGVSLPSTSASPVAARPPTARAQPQSLTPAANAAASPRVGALQPGSREPGGRVPSTGALPPSSFKPTDSKTIQLDTYQQIFLKYYERYLDVWI